MFWTGLWHSEIPTLGRGEADITNWQATRGNHSLAPQEEHSPQGAGPGRRGNLTVSPEAGPFPEDPGAAKRQPGPTPQLAAPPGRSHHHQATPLSGPGQRAPRRVRAAAGTCSPFKCLRGAPDTQKPQRSGQTPCSMPRGCPHPPGLQAHIPLLPHPEVQDQVQSGSKLWLSNAPRSGPGRGWGHRPEEVGKASTPAWPRLQAGRPPKHEPRGFLVQ
ncbi:uncharacterized protein LOC141488357 [Macrotis lagotis]|uniref:uncharacterized protein LOC141488357 n=1 Tax=Macrotis lagotis TaxID=92651 RepID=UPI003D699EB1